MMIKSLFMILVTFSTSKNILLCEDLCSNYDDQNCVHPNAIKNGHFTNQWAVYLPGTTKEQARLILEEKGFDYLGQVIDGVELHKVTKKGTPEKHAMPNKDIIELLKKHEKVKSVEQMHTLQDSKNNNLFTLIEENEVECLPFDPHTIKLNDGSDNFKRIQTSESTEGNIKSPTSTMSRPISNNHISDTADIDHPLVFNHYQTYDLYDKSVNEKKKRKRLNNEEMESKSEESNNEESSNGSISESTEGDESPTSTMSRPVSNNHKSDTVGTNQKDDSYYKNINEKNKQKRHFDKEMENEQSNNEESSDDKD